MKWLADECLDQQIVDRLKSEGHDVLSVTDLEPGISDDEVLALAVRDGRIVLTSDKGFGELVVRRQLIATGVVLVRLSGMSPEKKALFVSAFVTRHEADISGSFVVVTSTGVRVRRFRT